MLHGCCTKQLQLLLLLLLLLRQFLQLLILVDVSLNGSERWECGIALCLPCQCPCMFGGHRAHLHSCCATLKLLRFDFEKCRREVTCSVASLCRRGERLQTSSPKAHLEHKQYLCCAFLILVVAVEPQSTWEGDKRAAKDSTALIKTAHLVSQITFPENPGHQTFAL